MIQLTNVSKHYNNRKAVDGVSIKIEEGETIVLLGSSGCGKTTTLRMINRLTEPTTGNIFVNGQSIKEQAPELLRRQIGYVLQHYGLFPHYTVAENIAVVPKLLNWTKEKIEKRIAELLEKVHLSTNTAYLYPSQLSGGQQQRVGLARALASYPSVLLMDEPFGALDPVTRAGIRKDFTCLDELKKKTILMVTHDVQEAFELGDRICLMDKGKIIQIGTPKELLFHPANEFVAAFLKEHNLTLELKTTLIKDIWTLLPKAVAGIEEIYLSPEYNLWQAIETISAAGKSGSLRFVSNIKNDKRQIDFASLMAAYAHVKHSNG